MGNLVFQATLGGQVNLVGPNTASTYNINVPAVAGTMVTTGDSGTVTSGMLASSLSLTTPNIGVATGTSLKVSAGFYSTSSSSFTYTDGIVMDYTTGLGRISVGTSDGLAFYNAGVATTELMRLDSAGNLGLGVTPSAWRSNYRVFQSGNGAAFSGANTSLTAWVGSNWYVNSGNTDTYIANGYATQYAQYSGQHVWFTAPSGTAGNAITFTQAMTLDASGNLRVGTTSGSFNGQTLYGANDTYLSVYAASGKNGGLIFGGNGTENQGNLFYSSSGNYAQLAVNPAGSYLVFQTAGSERARIDSSGNLLVGTTSSLGGGGGKFQVAGGTGNGIQTYTTATSSYSALNCRVDATASYLQLFYYNTWSSTVGSITTNGTGVNYGSASDYRLKEDVYPMTGALEKVAALKPVTYKWKSNGSAGQGFIAHELQEVIPDAVTGEKDGTETYIDEEGNEQTRSKYQNIDTSFLVATLTAAIQEQQQLITQLQADVAALKAPQ